MPSNNVAILSIMSKFDEKSAREAAQRANKVYDEALSDIGNVNFDKKLLENFDKAMSLLKNKFKKVNLSSYTNNLLDSIFSDKDIAEKSKDIESFIKKIDLLKRASSGQDINAFNTFSAKQIEALISRTEKLAQKQDEINEKTREYNREATKIAKTNRSISTIDKNYGNQDYTRTLESLKKSLGTEKEFTAEQNQSIENLAKMVNLYQTMEKSEPQKGTAEAIRYSKDLLAVTQKIKEERDKIDSFSQKGASAYIFNNGLSSIDKVSDYTVNKAKDDFTKASISNLKAQESKLQSELTTYISDSVQKNIAKVSKEADAVIDKAEKRVENLQNKIDSLQSKPANTGTDNSLIGNIISDSDIKTLEEIEDRLYAISDLDAEGEATSKQLKEYIQLYKQYEQLIAGDSTVKFDPSLKEEYDSIVEADSKLKKYADTLDETIVKQKELNATKSDEKNTSTSVETEQLVKQEEQIKQTVQAEEKLIDTQNQLSSNTKISVDAEQAITDINKVKENLESIPNEKKIKISVNDNDYTNTPLLSDAEGNTITAFRGVVGAWSGLINQDGIGFFTDKLKLAADYADSLAESGKVYQANLSFKNPLEVEGNGAKWDEIDFNGVKKTTDEIVELAKQLGYDGVIFKNVRDGFTDTEEDISNVMVALNAAQIKNEQVIGTVKAGTGEMVEVASKIDNATDTATNSTVESQNKIQEELKETQKVAEQVSEAMSNVSSDKSNISSENQIVESQNKIQDELKETRQEAEKTAEALIEVYRGVTVKGTNGISDKGITFASSRPDIAALGLIERGMSGEGKVSDGEIFKETISLANAFYIDAQKRTFDAIAYWGDETNEAGKKAKAAYESLIKSVQDGMPLLEKIDDPWLNLPEDIEKCTNAELEFLNMLFNHEDTPNIDENTNKLIKTIREQYESFQSIISENPMMGIQWTDDFAEQVQKMGYSVLVIKDVIDSYEKLSQDLANDYVILDPSAIKNVELYTEALSELTKVRLKYIDAAKYTDTTAEEMVKNQFLDSEGRFLPEASNYFQKEFGDNWYQEYYKILADESTALEIAKKIVSYAEEARQAYSIIFSQSENIIGSQAKENISSETPIKDVFQGDAEKTGMDNIASATEEAVQAKKDFATANEGVQSSVDGSKSKLELEAELMNQIAKSAREAADAKKEFVDANKEVKDSAESSNSSLKKDKYKNKSKVSEDDYNPEKYASIANQRLTDNGNTILGNSVNTELVDGLVKVNAKIKTVDGTWKTFSAKIDADGNMFEQRFRTITKNVNKLDSELVNFGKDSVSTPEKLSEQKKIYSELNEALNRYSTVSKRIAGGNDLENDEKDAKDLLKTINELRSKEVLSQEQLKASEIKLNNIKKACEDIKEITNKNTLESMQSEIDSYNKKVPSKPIKGNRSVEYQNAINNYTEAIQKAQTFLNNLGNNPITTDIENQWDELTRTIKEAKEEMDSFSASQKGSTPLSRGKTIEWATDLLKQNTKWSKAAKIEVQGWIDKLATADPSNIEEIRNEILKVVRAEREAGNEGKSWLDIFSTKKLHSFLGQAASMFNFYDLIRYVREGISAVKEFDDGLTKISYTMDMTKSQLNDLGSSVLDMASDMKSSVDDAMSVAQIYANMQTTAEEIQSLSEPTLILANLSGFDSSTIADDIQAVNQQFNILAEDSMHIADVYDYISRNIAVDYSKGLNSMAEGLQVAGSTAKQAGLSFEQTSAIIAKAVEKTRLEGSQVGNGLKTILTRTSKVGELSDEVDNETLSQASESLKKIGIEVYNLDGSYREFDVIMTELAGKWDKLTDAEKSNISFSLAATRQTNLLSAILSNFADSMQLAEEATNAEGSALENQQKYMDSFAGHLQSLETEAKIAWINILDSETLKGGVDLLTGLVKVVGQLVDKFGLLGTAGITIGAVQGFKKLDYASV